jgi:integral membrane protein (TIGR01906 family)
VLLIAGGAWLLQDRKIARRCAWLSPLILLVPLGAFAIWAAVDFDGAFTFFHRLLFTNDLWLLDPRTDLLIRICPESMFAAMGLRIALLGLGGMAGVTALAVLLTHIWPKQKQSEGNSWNDNRATRRAAAQRPKTFDVGGKR